MATRINVSDASKSAATVKEGLASDLETNLKDQVAVQVPAEQSTTPAKAMAKDLKKKAEEEESEDVARSTRSVEEAEASEEVAEAAEGSADEELASSEEVTAEEQASIDQIQEYAAELDASAQTQLVAAQDFGNWFAQAATGAGAAAGGAAAGISTTAIIAGVAVVGVAAAAGGSSSSGTSVTSGGDVVGGGDSVSAPTINIPSVTGNFALATIDTSALQTEVVPAAPAPSFYSTLTFSDASANPISLAATAGSLMATGGTDGADLFTATTFAQLADVELLGGAGTDKLKFSLDGGDGELNAAGDGVINSTGIEILEVTNSSTTDELIVSTGNMDGLQEAHSTSSKADVTFTDATLDTTLVINSVAAGTTTISYASDAIAAAATTAAGTVVLNGTSAAAAVEFDTSAAAGGLAEIVVSSNGATANTIASLTETPTASDAVKTLTIQGQTGLTITGELDDGLSALTKIDASELDGALNLNLGAMAAAIEISAGSADYANKVTASIAAAAIAPTITRVDTLTLDFTVDSSINAAKVVGLETVNLTADANATPSFTNLESGVAFKTTEMSSDAVSKFYYRNLSDFDLDINAATTAAAISFNGFDFEKVRNADIAAANKTATVGLGEISFDSNGKSLTVSHTGSAALTVGNVDSESEDNFSVIATGSTASGTITFDNIDAVGTVNLNLVASKSDVAVDDVTSSAGRVVANLNASGEEVTIDDVQAATGVAITASASSSTTAADQEKVSIGEISTTAGDVTINATLGASGSSGDGAEIEIGNVDSSDGSFGLTLNSGGGDQDTIFLMGTADVSGDIAVAVTTSAGSDVDIGALTSTDGGDIGVSIVNGSSSSNTSSVVIGNNDDLSTDGQVSVEVTNGASGEVVVGDLVSGESDVVLSITSNGKAGAVTVGNLEATGLGGTATVSVLSNAGNVDIESIDVDGNVSVNAVALAGSDTTIVGAVDSGQGAISITANAASSTTSRSNVELSNASTITADKAVTIAVTLGSGGNLDIGDVTSSTSDVSMTIVGGTSASRIDTEAVEAEGSVTYNLSLGTSSAASIEDLVATSGDNTVTVTAASKSGAAGNTDVGFANIDANAGAVSVTISDLGTDGNVSIVDITGTDSVTFVSSIQKDASVSVTGNVDSDGKVSLDLTAGQASSYSFVNVDSALGEISVDVSRSTDTVSSTTLEMGDLTAATSTSVTFDGGASSTATVGGISSGSGSTTVSISGGAGSVVSVANLDDVSGRTGVEVTLAVGNSNTTTSSIILGNVDSSNSTVDVSLTSGSGATVDVGALEGSGKVTLTSVFGGNSTGNLETVTSTTGDVSVDVELAYSSAGGSVFTIGNLDSQAGDVMAVLDVGRSNELNVGNVSAAVTVDVAATVNKDSTLDIGTVTSTTSTVDLALAGGANSGVTSNIDAVTAFGDADVGLASGGTATINWGDVTSDAGDVSTSLAVGSGSTVSVGNLDAYGDLSVAVSIGGNSGGAVVGDLLSATGDITVSSLAMSYSSSGASDANIDAVTASDGFVKFTSIDVGNTNALTIGDVTASGTATDGVITVTKATVGTTGASLNFGDLTADTKVLVSSLAVGSDSDATFGNIESGGLVDITATMATGAELSFGTAGISGVGVTLDITGTGQGGNIDITGNIDATTGKADLSFDTSATQSAVVTLPTIDGDTVKLYYKGAGADSGTFTSAITADKSTAAATVIDIEVDGSGNVDFTLVAEAGTKTTTDASGSSGVVSITTSEANDTVKLGSGTSNVTMGGNGEDVIDLGTGIDTIELSGFTGNLEIDVASGDTGFTASGVIDVLANFDTAAQILTIDTGLSISGVTAGANIDSYVDFEAGNQDTFAAVLASANANLDGSTAFVYGGFANGDGAFYVFIDHDKSGTVNAGDSILKFDGAADLSSELSGSINFIA